MRVDVLKIIGEFYGRNPPTANLELLARFFEKYPGLADKAFLSVKASWTTQFCCYFPI